MISMIPDNLTMAVLQEMNRSQLRFGAMPGDLLRCAAIVVEESCEAMAEAMIITRTSPPNGSHRGAKGTRGAMQVELEQTISAAVLAWCKIQDEIDKGMK